ncbi:MAG: hypothetical protein ACO3EP_10575 [Phycisphaerales bacterium]
MRPRRRCAFRSTLLAIVAALAAHPAAAAIPASIQDTLDLEADPRLGPQIVLRDTIAALEREAADLGAEDPAIAARRRLRLVGVALLSAPGHAPIAHLAGLRLAESRRELDRAIARIHRSDVAASDRRGVDYARLLLARFAEVDLGRIAEASASPTADLDAALADALAPLLGALLAESGGDAANHWPTIAGVPIAKVAPTGSNDSSLDAIEDPSPESRRPSAMHALDARADALATIEIHRELRALRATLRQSHQRASARWRRSIEESAGAERDLAISAAIAAAASHAADLERLVLLSRLLDSVAAIDRRAMQPAALRARAIAAPLSQPLQRPQAARDIDRLLAQQPLQPVPFEAMLGDTTQPLPEPISTARSSIATRLGAQRRRWIAAWTQGKDQDAEAIEQSVRLLREMLGIADSGVASASEGSAGSRLARWAAVLVVPEAVDGAIASLAPRVALALDAWLRGDLPATARHLEGWRRAQPFAALAVAIDDAIGPQLAELRGGAIGVIECLAIPPDSTAFMIDRRRDLAELSLLAAELRRASTLGDSDRSDRLRSELERRVEALLR